MKPPKITPEELAAFGGALKAAYDMLVGAGFAPSEALSLIAQTLGTAMGTSLTAYLAANE